MPGGPILWKSARSSSEKPLYCRKSFTVSGVGDGTSKEEKARHKENLTAAAENLKAGAAKCALMADEICGNCAIASPLLGSLQKNIAAICAICYAIQASTCCLIASTFLWLHQELIRLSLSLPKT